jgi:PBP1b-binding outer membrane lipoprotein LpoB
MINANDLELLATDSFDSMTEDYATDDKHIDRLKHHIAIYLKTGDNVGLTPETKRLVDSLINFTRYQLDTRVESVSSFHTSPLT